MISIAIPFYNADEFLERAILSVVNQTFQDWELLLIDDGSKDSSLAIATSFQDSRIKVLCDGTNKGLAGRLNESVLLATGKYYARMDADDIMHVERLQKQWEFLEANVSIDVVGAGAYSIDDDDAIIGLRENPDEYPNLKKTILECGLFIHPTVLGKREWFLEHKYNEKLFRSEDSELWIRSFNTSNFSNLQEPLLFYREFGVLQKKKYIKSQLELLNWMKVHVLQEFNLFLWLKLKLKIWAKIFVYLFSGILYDEKILIKRRSILLQKEQQSKAELQLKKSLSRA